MEESAGDDDGPIGPPPHHLGPGARIVNGWGRGEEDTGEEAMCTVFECLWAQMEEEANNIVPSPRYLCSVC